MSLTAADIALLIEAASKHNVTQFTAGDVSFTFSGHRPAPSVTGDFAQALQDAKDWMEESPVPPPFVEVE